MSWVTVTGKYKIKNKYTHQNDLRTTFMEISIYANFCRVYGQNRSRYPNIVACFLKWNMKGMFSVKIIALNFFILKFVKNAIFHPKIKN